MKSTILAAALLILASPALALTCAHVETGQALDPQPCSTIGQYLARYTAQVTQGWSVAIVPDGTQHNAAATHNQDGTWSTVNPSAPSISAPKILTKTAFQDYAISQFGGGTTGMARFTTIMDATSASASAAVRFAYARYQAAPTFEKENVALLTSIMAADSTTGHLTAAERTALLDNWPTQ